MLTASEIRGPRSRIGIGRVTSVKCSHPERSIMLEGARKRAAGDRQDQARRRWCRSSSVWGLDDGKAPAAPVGMHCFHRGDIGDGKGDLARTRLTRAFRLHRRTRPKAQHDAVAEGQDRDICFLLDDGDAKQRVIERGAGRMVLDVQKQESKVRHGSTFRMRGTQNRCRRTEGYDVTLSVSVSSHCSGTPWTACHSLSSFARRPGYFSAMPWSVAMRSILKWR